MKQYSFFGVMVMIAAALSAANPAAAATSSETLQAVQRDYWEYRLSEFPLFATSTGDTRRNDQLDSVTVTDWQRRERRYEEFLAELDALDVDALSDTERMNYQILRRLLSDSIAELRFQDHLMP